MRTEERRFSPNAASCLSGMFCTLRKGLTIRCSAARYSFSVRRSPTSNPSKRTKCSSRKTVSTNSDSDDLEQAIARNILEAIGRGHAKNMTDITSKPGDKLDNWNDSGPWYEGTHGERIAVRVSSLDTNGAYAIVESIAAPGCATPMHLYRNEAEHFVIIAGSYRIAIGEKIFEASAGPS